MMTNPDKIFTLYRGDADFDPKSAREYSGITYFARFSSSVSINITTVGFYGRKPAYDESFRLQQILGDEPDEDISPLLVTIILDIRESAYFKPCKNHGELKYFLREMKTEMDVSKFKQDKVFFVQLPKPVNIPPGIIFEIGFQLNGKSEKIKFHSLAASENTGRVIKPKGCHVEISVHHSCSQCAGFQFTLDNNTLYESVAQLQSSKKVLETNSKQKTGFSKLFSN